MTTLSFLHGSFLGFAAIFVCMGVGMISLRRATSRGVGTGYWAASFFLNSAGFLFWAVTIPLRASLFFVVGEVLHILGFIVLVSGVYRFVGNSFKRWNVSALGGFALCWLVAIGLIVNHREAGFLLLMGLRTLLFVWAGRMILKHSPTKTLAGRKLAGWGLISWGIYVLLMPFLWQFSGVIHLMFGFLVGLHILAGMGMMALVVDRMRIQSERVQTRANQLEGLLPICAHCKKIRDDQNNWQRIETYIRDHSDAQFSHGICPDCSERLYGDQDWYIQMKEKKNRDTIAPSSRSCG